MPIESMCGRLTARISLPWWFTKGDVSFFYLGPYENILEMKAYNKPYTVERFRIYGKITAKTDIIGLGVLSANYLGRQGVEVGLGEIRRSPAEGATYIELPVDKYIDVDREWRGLGLQVIKVHVEAYGGCDVTVTADLCFDLTWVG